MLKKGASISKLCDDHPSYKGAISKTFYGKSKQPVTRRTNGDDQFDELDLDFTFRSNKKNGNNFMSRNRRNQSVAVEATKQMNRISDLAFSQVSLD